MLLCLMCLKGKGDSNDITSSLQTNFEAVFKAYMKG